jgi:hypothetical protein
VDREQSDEDLVAFTAAKDDQVFSWDVSATLAASLRDFFESEGWEVTIAIAEGPRRRHFPRVSRRPNRRRT